MKKSILSITVAIFMLSVPMAFAGTEEVKAEGEKSALPVQTENKLSEEEVSRLTKRVEEIRDMNKSEMSSGEKKALKKEVKEIKSTVKNNSGGPTIIISGSALVLIILLIILL